MIRKSIYIVLTVFISSILIKCGVTRVTYEIELVDFKSTGFYINNIRTYSSECFVADTVGFLFKIETRSELIKKEKLKNFDLIPEAQAAYDPAIINVANIKDSIVSFDIFGLSTDLINGQNWINVNFIFTANRFDNKYGLMNDSIFYETLRDNTIRTFVETILKKGYNTYYDLAFICSDNNTLSNIDSLKFDLRLESGKIVERKIKIMNINGLQ